MTYDSTDVRAALPRGVTIGPSEATDPPVHRAMTSDAPTLETPAGSRIWIVPGEAFVVAYAIAKGGDRLEVRDSDELMIVTADLDPDLTIETAAGTSRVSEPAVAIAPPGTTGVRIAHDAELMLVASVAGNSLLDAIASTGSLTGSARQVDPLPAPEEVAPTGSLQVHPLSGVPTDPARFGRIFRSRSLMVNVFEHESGPRDPERLSPHRHETFEQCSVTLAGDYIHHLRTPWTTRLSQWRDDLHLTCASPSITMIPPGVIHTTRGIGEGVHRMVDVFAPARSDFLEAGWVLNAHAYDGGQMRRGSSGSGAPTGRG